MKIEPGSLFPGREARHGAKDRAPAPPAFLKEKVLRKRKEAPEKEDESFAQDFSSFSGILYSPADIWMPDVW